uniref:YGGT family, conserved hypothetical integral membrane protein n=1 Tax=Paulinella chromatophora TaxID=39717 RepID=B1X572_PAUCH|nr:YGGT family, conserved hypothetical integral membrane protein [Paulinella chromatophora]ACB43091.1 YGGT family, conserved hypothetical integral membrane protein [Paulinella chromatophora]
MTGFVSDLSLIRLILGLCLNIWNLLFLFRIVLTWYPQVDFETGILLLVSVPTEGFLVFTRRLVAPLGGIDITPIIWVGISSLLREFLIGQQGLLSQVMLYDLSISMKIV